MKVLWVCNVPIPMIAEDIGVKAPNICGWLTGFANEVNRAQQLELSICFPLLGAKKMVEGRIGKIRYFSFSQPKLMKVLPAEDQVHESELMREHISAILKKVRPDIVNIFGTEYPHAKVAAELFRKPDRTVVHIQGLTSCCWMHYNTGIPYKQLKKFVFSNIVRGNLLKQAEKMKERGCVEKAVLENVGHVTGRTDWDRACCLQTNSKLNYHFCNESLRDSFYVDEWDYDTCRKHSIFMSQASTPIKGLHILLRALPEIIRYYPDTHLYIAGNNFVNRNSLYSRLKFSSYASYISELIEKNNLADHITFTGHLDEEGMKKRFMSSNVFVLPSVIENSPNSLGEAMLLGLPCVAADVGGVKNLMVHDKEGYVYQADAPYMLSYYVKQIFDDSDKAAALGKAAACHARITHDRKTNFERLMEIYNEIAD